MESLIFSLGSGVCIGAAAAYLGTLMLSRRMALVAGPLGHLTLPGVALALIWGIDVSVGAFPFVLLGVLAIWLFEAKTRLPPESLTALVFASGVAIAFLFLPVDQAEVALVGDIATITAAGAALSAVASLAIALVLWRTYPRMVLANISAELAAAEDVDVRRYELLYLLLVAVVVALGVRMVGGLLTAALVAIPPAAARNLARNLRQYRFGAVTIGVLSAVTGILVSHVTALPAGPLIILTSTAIFLLTVIAAR